MVSFRGSNTYLRKMSSDVDITDLAAQTKNFTGAEIEGLVRAALSTAMTPFIQV